MELGVLGSAFGDWRMDDIFMFSSTVRHLGKKSRAQKIRETSPTQPSHARIQTWHMQTEWLDGGSWSRFRVKEKTYKSSNIWPENIGWDWIFWLGGRQIIVKALPKYSPVCQIGGRHMIRSIGSDWIENFLHWFCVEHVWGLQNSYFDFVDYFVSQDNLYWLLHRISLNKYVFS